MDHLSTRALRRYRNGFSIAAIALLANGCVSTVPVLTTNYDIHVKIDPSSHRLTGDAELICTIPPNTVVDPTKSVAIEFELNPNLQLRDVVAEDVEITGTTSRPSPVADSDDGDDKNAPTIHRITLRRPAQAFRLRFFYDGELTQDVESGEKKGEIHNFKVSAHIGDEGTYLDAGGSWYPMPYEPDEEHETGQLAHFRLRVDPVDGYTFIGGADTDTGSVAPNGGLVVESRFPQTDMALVGGPYRTWARDLDGRRVSIYLRETADDATLDERANLFLDAAIGYLNRYEPLLGPYPFDEFAIVENFFSSGFAFPSFTLLGPTVLQMGERSLRHGYLDHELLHSWWGNSVYVNPAGGNWCEALASYAANYYGYILDDDEAGARAFRRNACNMLSRISARRNKPLAAFGQDDDMSRGIGYQKGAMVFHMLTRKMGLENFWEAMRTLNTEFTGRFVDWTTIEAICRRHTDVDLAPFFKQWVYGRGAPRFVLESAQPMDGAPGRTLIKIVQKGEPVDVDLPLRLRNGDGEVRDVIAHITQPVEHVSIEGVIPPATIELDPDYDILRKLDAIEVMPTLASASRGPVCHVLVPPGDLWAGYDTFVNTLTNNRMPNTVRKIVMNPEAVTRPPVTTLAVIGDAVRHPDVQALLECTKSPVKWTETGFEIEGTAYDDPGDAVLFTIHHPDAPEWTVTVYYGNSERALSNAGILWFYGNSLLVYETPDGDSGSDGHGGAPRAKVIRRIDFEETQRLEIPATIK